MDKFEIIKNFLLDESISPEIRRERFDIAWDIRNHLDEIKKFLRQKIFEEVVEKLRNSEEFKDYEKVDNGFLRVDKWGNFTIYKKAWLLNEKPLLSYAIEMGKYNFYDIYYGIKKQNDKIPFIGKWTSADLPQELIGILKSLQNILENWNVSEWWIFWKYFDGFLCIKK